MYRIKTEVKEHGQSTTLLIIGTLYLLLRLRSTLEFQENYVFEPEVTHISYIISLLTAFAIMTSFRHTALNAIPVAVFPSFFITIPFWDIPKYMVFSTLTFWEKVNVITIHEPPFLIGIWILKNRKDLLSIEALKPTIIFGLCYFVFIDNKDNDVGLNGIYYTLVVLAVFAFWYPALKHLLKETNLSDPFLANLVLLKRVKEIK